jgi:hypothetical protein
MWRRIEGEQCVIGRRVCVDQALEGLLMELSVDQFIKLVTATPETREVEDDQRRSPRVGLRAQGTIIPLCESSQPTAISIEVRDLSPLGIGFLHERKMSLDEKFALVLPRTGDTPSVVLCAVAFWQPLARDLFAIGARFTRILRDGGETPLPIQINTPVADLADEIKRLHRKAS